MTIAEALSIGSELLSLSGVPDARLDAEYLMAYLCDSPRLLLRLCGEQALPQARFDRYMALCGRRAEREPLQYILGTQDFMGHTFIVRPFALIPRMDTETLCEQAILRTGNASRVLDMCTGSGALGISVKKALPQCEVTLCDISTEALALARENAGALHADVRIMQGDLFAPLTGETFDIIICNPPYIKTGELSVLQKEVRFEPTPALDGGEDGLSFYRRIASEAPGHIAHGGSILCEIGDGQADDVKRLFDAVFDDVTIINDLCRNPRVVAAKGRG